MGDLLIAGNRRRKGLYIPLLFSISRKLTLFVVQLRSCKNKYPVSVVGFNALPSLYNYIPEWEEGTCEWVFTHPSSQAWTVGFSRILQSLYGFTASQVRCKTFRQCLLLTLFYRMRQACNGRCFVSERHHKTRVQHFFRNTADNSSSIATAFTIAILAQLFGIGSVKSEPRSPTAVGSILP